MGILNFSFGFRQTEKLTRDLDGSFTLPSWPVEPTLHSVQAFSPISNHLYNTKKEPFRFFVISLWSG